MRTILFTTLIIGALSLSAAAKNLFIVTTDQIAGSSAKLAEFVAAKEARGFTVTVTTESDYGAADAKGLVRAVAIRDWLKENTAPGDYLLLIGDANAQYGDVPMFIVWPRHTYSADQCFGFAVDCRAFESDAPYADLSGDWDLNGNGQWGEQGLDDGEGGFDLDHELIVGRMSVYFDDTTELDRILGHALDYMRTPESAVAWRKKILLPASYYYFKGQKMLNSTVLNDMDGADTAEWFIHNIMAEHGGFTLTRMYEKEGTTVSKYAADVALTRDNLKSEWPKGYGMVFWFGHGLDKEVARTIWIDANDDGAVSNDELQQPLFIHSDDAPAIGAQSPAFVVAVSCEVGSAQTPWNLTHALLTEGGAIGMIGSTNVTPGDMTDYSDFESDLDTTTYGATNLGVFFFDKLMSGETAAKAFAETRRDVGTDGSIETDAGKMMLNYYGDPTLSLNSSAADAPDEDLTPDEDTATDSEIPDVKIAETGSENGCALVTL
ncbi:MAG TPA: C25 family cysteine peptidase [bacterium]|nr:C25 family cysteine peptidase [bacterium]